MAGVQALSCTTMSSSTGQPDPSPRRLSTTDEYRKLIAQYDTFLFDCDGVLWSGDDLIPGAASVLEKLRAQGKQVVFVTNNASKSRRAYKGKFDKLNIRAEEVCEWAKGRHAVRDGG